MIAQCYGSYLYTSIPSASEVTTYMAQVKHNYFAETDRLHPRRTAAHYYAFSVYQQKLGKQYLSVFTRHYRVGLCFVYSVCLVYI